jgi:hydrogenase-4 membrane subunit HyfE
MDTGLILLAFIAALFTFGFTKVRRRMGLGVTSKHWVIAFVAAFLVILVIWANGHT